MVKEPICTLGLLLAFIGLVHVMEPTRVSDEDDLRRSHAGPPGAGASNTTLRARQ
jgi:hypothetical protein